jgi:hypothetical protein
MIGFGVGCEEELGPTIGATGMSLPQERGEKLKVTE